MLQISQDVNVMSFLFGESATVSVLCAVDPVVFQIEDRVVS